jgi:hypothetical protein
MKRSIHRTITGIGKIKEEKYARVRYNIASRIPEIVARLISKEILNDIA